MQQYFVGTFTDVLERAIVCVFLYQFHPECLYSAHINILRYYAHKVNESTTYLIKNMKIVQPTFVSNALNSYQVRSILLISNRRFLSQAKIYFKNKAVFH